MRAALEVACKHATKRFQSHTEHAKFSDVAEILGQLEQMRLTTVQAIEAIVAWRKYVEGQGKMRSQKDKANGWIATISVTGDELIKPSPAFLVRATGPISYKII